jgi:uncharacterized phage protein (TIGR01671 family)
MNTSRIIKFRAWDKEEKKMLDLNGSVEGETSFNGMFKEPTLVFMQFTGLLDRKGVPIYEGDIVKETYPKKDKEMMGEDWHTINVVEYEEKLAMFVLKKDNEITDCFETFAKIEVIGNIFQHPELLEKNDI